MRPSTISQLLRPIRHIKNATINKSTIQQIQRIVISKSPVYHYEVLSLYNHFANNYDDIAFNKIDQLFFPARSKQPKIEVSLQLAYRRLYCLLKYRLPYGSWVKITRQLIHQTKITPIDVKYLVNLIAFDSVKLDKIFQQIYEQFVTIFEEEVKNIDTLTLIALRKAFNKYKLNSTKYQSANEKLQAQIQSSLQALTNAQLKFLFNAKRLTNKQFFQYFFKAHVSTIKKYAFFMMLLTSKSQWSQFMLKKYNRQFLLDKLPFSAIKGRPIAIVEGIFANYTSQRPYIDQFFQFVQHQQGDKVIKKLANPQHDYEVFLYNALYYLFPGIKQTDSFNHIQTVLSETQYLPKNISAVFVYFTIKQSLIFFMYENDLNIKRQKDIALVKQTSTLLQTATQSQSTFFKGSLILATKAFRNLAALELEAIKMPQFQSIITNLKKLSQQHYTSLKIFQPDEFKEIYNILIEYRSSLQKPTDNDMFFGEFKKYKCSNSQILIYMARQIEVNRKLQVDYLIRVVNIQTKKQVKYLLDFTYYTRSRDNKKVSLGKFWKHRYLNHWCGLEYYIQKWVTISEYLQSPSFQSIANQVLQK